MKWIFRGLAYTWIVLGSFLVLAGYIGIFLESGFSGLKSILNPFNFANTIAIIIVILPGILLLKISNRSSKNPKQLAKKIKPLLISKNFITSQEIQRTLGSGYKETQLALADLQEKGVFISTSKT